MRQRCIVGRQRSKRYGDRGILVCDIWENDFLVFREWAILNGYRKGLSIDRVNNDGDYSPQNCRWATRPQQMRNTADNRNISFQGETLCQVDWATRIGISVQALRWRIDHWSLERSLTTEKLR